MSTITETRHGRYVHGKPRHVGNGTYRRSDLWQSKSGSESEHTLAFAAGPDDDSPIYNDSRHSESCHLCYLNFAHTQAAHAASITNLSQ